MRLSFLRAILCLPILLVLALPAVSLGAIFPNRDDGNTEIIILEESDLEIELRVKLILSATQSVQILNFMHVNDEVGLRLIAALRDRMQHGVTVQQAYEGSISVVGGDRWLEVPKLLTDSNLKNPAQLITGRIKDKLKSKGLALNDYIHEKMIIIDADTPNEKILFGGRAPSVFTRETIDRGFLVRPVDPTRPYLGTDMRNFFNDFWKTLSSVYRLEPPKPLSRKLTDKVDRIPLGVQIAPPLAPKFNGILEIVTAPAHQNDVLAPYQFRPKSIRFVTNDLLKRLIDTTPPKTIYNRPDWELNDITMTLAQILGEAKNVDFTSYSLGLPAPLRERVIQMVQRGDTVRFLTNGREAHRYLNPLGLPIDFTSVSYLGMIKEMGEAAANFHLFYFDPNKASEPPPVGSKKLEYLHSKLMLTDRFGVVGCDNFTISSATHNDEFVVIVEDERFVETLRAQNNKDLEGLFERVDEKFVRSDLRRTHWFSRFCLDIIKSLY